ncbi:hypothetical protein [Hydrogenivirga sp.]
MKRRFLKTISFFLNPFLLLSCGIKTDVEPLPKPDYSLKRVGEFVYVIPKDAKVIPEGFQRRGKFFIKRNRDRFCFKVRHLEGREELACVKEAQEFKPSLRTELSESELTVLFDTPGLYRVYPYKDSLIPLPLKEVKDKKVSLERLYKPYRVAITRVVGSVETSPRILEVPPRKPPPPPKPESLRLAVKGGKVYLYWWSEEEGLRFLVYRDGKLLTEEPVFQNVFVDTLPEGKALYEVRAVNKFGAVSEPARVIYRP